MLKNISNLGDAALYCDFGAEVNKQINSEVIKYFNTIKEKNIEGINNLTPSYNKLIISYDLRKTNFKEIRDKIEKLDIGESLKTKNKKLEIPVCCDASFSLDIERLEKKLNLTKEKILVNFFNKELIENGIIPSLINWKSNKPVYEMKNNQLSLNKIEIEILDNKMQYKKIMDTIGIIEKLRFSGKNKTNNQQYNKYPRIKAFIKDNNSNKNIVL